MKINQGIIPPNNYHFPVENGVILRAATYELLIKEIETWRTQNGVPIGDPAKDIDNYVCSKWPHACHIEAQEEKMVQKNSDLLKQVNGWAAITLRNMPQGGYELVDQNVAEKRCGTCLECPFNRPWKKGCVNCMVATDTILARIRQLKKITLDESLLGCSINGFDNKTAIHLPDSFFELTEDQKSSLPQNCWIKQLTT